LIVTTKTDLEKAQSEGASEIVIEGELANRVRIGRKIKSAGKLSLICLGAAIAAIPLTGGLSMAAAAPVAAFTGLEVAVIMAVAFVGLGLLISIWQGYEEVEFSQKPLRLVLRKKSK